MKKFLTLAACAALLAGCDFLGGSDVDPIAFSSLTITSSPLPADRDGTAPDLYVEIQDAGGRAIYAAPEILQEADASVFPYTIDVPGELTGSTRSYFVVVMDRNDDGNRLIVASDGFSADDLRASSSDAFEVSNAAGTLQAELSIAR
jgi:hypothetical protein